MSVVMPHNDDIFGYQGGSKKLEIVVKRMVKKSKKLMFPSAPVFYLERVNTNL
jgi:hypothetical protein